MDEIPSQHHMRLLAASMAKIKAEIEGLRAQGVAQHLPNKQSEALDRMELDVYALTPRNPYIF